MRKEQSGLLVSETSLLGMQAVGPHEDFLEKWFLQSQGETQKGRKLVLVFTAGMRRGVVTTAVLSGLQNLGFTPEGIQAIVGSSVGATIAREYGARDLSKPAGEAKNNLAALRKLFVNDWIETPEGRQIRGIFKDKWLPPLVDFKVTEDELFRKVGASEEAVKAAVPKIYIGLRDMEKGERKFVNQEEIPDTVVAAISTMTIDFITLRNQTPIKLNSDPKDAAAKMYADPLHKDSELIKFAIEKLDATDIGIFFTSDPFKNNLVNNILDYFLTLMEHRNNRHHLFEAYYALRSADKSPRYFKELFGRQNGVNISGFFPSRHFMAPNELNLELVSKVDKEAEIFGHNIGAPIRNRILHASNL